MAKTGRPPIPVDKRVNARRLVYLENKTITEAARELGIHRNTAGKYAPKRVA